MHCQTCGAAFRGRGRLCGECTKTLSGVSNTKQAPASLDGFSTEQNQEAIAPRYKQPLSQEGGWSRPTLIRTNIIPLALGGRFAKRTWLTAVGAAGLAASIGELAFRWGVWPFWLIIPSGVAFFIGHGLMRKGFVRFADLINVESDKAGRVYLTTLGGDCPVCRGEVKLKDVGAKRESKVVIQCKEEFTHRWEFDSRQLDELKP